MTGSQFRNKNNFLECQKRFFVVEKQSEFTGNKLSALMHFLLTRLEIYASLEIVRKLQKYSNKLVFRRKYYAERYCKMV